MRTPTVEREHSKRMRESYFQAIYFFALGVLPLSLVMLAFAEGVLPFALTAAWTSEGAGTSLVLVHDTMSVASGDRVARAGAGTYEVSVYSVEAVQKKDGSTSYRATNAAGVADVPAREVTGGVVVSIPILGVWVRALGHPVGLMGLLGVPLVMVFASLWHGVVRSIRRVANGSRTTRAEENDAYDAADDIDVSASRRRVGDNVYAAMETYDDDTMEPASPVRARTESASGEREGMCVRIPPRRPMRPDRTIVASGLRSVVGGRHHHYGI